MVSTSSLPCLNAFLEGDQVRLGQVQYLVLDEADRMLEIERHIHC